MKLLRNSLLLLSLTLASCGQADKPAAGSAAISSNTTAESPNVVAAAKLADSLATSSEAAMARTYAAAVASWYTADLPAAIKEHPSVQQQLQRHATVLRLAAHARPLIAAKAIETESKQTRNGLFTSKVEKSNQALQKLLVLTKEGAPQELAGAFPIIEDAARMQAAQYYDARRYWEKFVVGPEE